HVLWLRTLNSTDAFEASLIGTEETQTNGIYTKQKQSNSSSVISSSNGCHLFEREDATNDLWYLRALYDATQSPWLPFLLACFGRQPTEIFSVTDLDNALQKT